VVRISTKLVELAKGQMLDNIPKEGRKDESAFLFKSTHGIIVVSDTPI